MNLTKLISNQPDEPYLAEVFEEFRQQGLWRATVLHSLVVAALTLWTFLFADHAVLYYVSLGGVAIALGLLNLALIKSNLYSCRYSYLLLLVDAVLLSLALFYQPGEGLQRAPEAQLIVYYFALIGLSAWAYSGELAAWTTLVSLTAWITGYAALALVGSPALQASLPGAASLLGHGSLLLLTGGMVSVALGELRYLLYKQVSAEHEYYAMLIKQAREGGDASAEYIDPVTSLGTRAAFDRDSALFTTVFAEGRLNDLTIAFIDIDNPSGLLKQYNKDGYHRLLSSFAKAARKRFRSSDMVYRFGSDQFVLLAPGSSMSNAGRLQTLLDDIVLSVRNDGFNSFKASMGVSTLAEVQRMSEVSAA